MDRYYIDRGWEAFQGIAEVMECHAIDPAHLVHRYTEQNYAIIVAVFEVVTPW